MKKHLAVITICTLALANAVPAMPVYAASKKPAAAYSAKQRREGQKKIKDAAPGSRSGEDALDSQEAQANEQTYEGEDQEMEGGWIEDAAEDGTQ